MLVAYREPKSLFRVMESPEEGRGGGGTEDSRRIVEYWETEIDTQDMTVGSGLAEKNADKQLKT